MTDFRPGDYRSAPAARQRGIGSWVFVILAFVLLAGGGWVYQFRPEWVRSVSVLGGSADVEFPALYQRYGIAPLGADTTGNAEVKSALARLQNEPCNKQAVFQASRALENLR